MKFNRKNRSVQNAPLPKDRRHSRQQDTPMQLATLSPIAADRGSSLTEDEARWQAVVRRDASADGHFFYSVRSTGIYCRPSCGSRQPKRENVRFHRSQEEAQGAGFRACKRCRPDANSDHQRHAALVATACRLIERSEEPLSLHALAETAGLSAYHFHRIFKQVAGVTPHAYAAAHRAQRVRTELGRSRTVTDAIYDAGFNSNGRFYADSQQLLGMTPTVFREGGADLTIRFAVGRCSLGAVLVAATDKGVCTISLHDDPEVLLRDLKTRFPRAELVRGDTDFESTVTRVVALVESPSQAMNLPLDVQGTAFQQRVWKALQAIPAGSTASYSEIAKRIGAPRAARAVAQACGANPVAVAIPCHRVVHRDHSRSGYRWGVQRKQALLEREQKE
jgi:AraC family transcriptional regulator of adaptative response/methylated-DNA-[protein]-cysteine methyltransferase